MPFTITDKQKNTTMSMDALIHKQKHSDSLDKNKKIQCANSNISSIPEYLKSKRMQLRLDAKCINTIDYISHEPEKKSTITHTPHLKESTSIFRIGAYIYFFKERGKSFVSNEHDMIEYSKKFDKKKKGN